LEKAWSSNLILLYNGTSKKVPTNFSLTQKKNGAFAPEP